jgi:hypothetical protein
LALLPNHRFTPRVEDILTRLSATVAFAEATTLLADVLGVAVSPASARRFTHAAGTAALAVEAADRAEVERACPDPPVHPDRLQLSIDATKVPLVGGEWTDVKLAVFADLVPTVTADGDPDVAAVNLTYVARWEPAEQFGHTLTLEAHRRGVDVAQDIASPNDGADWIQGILDLVALRAVRILDEPHAVEHLTVIATLRATGAAATTWVDQQRRRLHEDDEPTAMLADLRAQVAAGPRPDAPAGPDGLSAAAWLEREGAYFAKRAAQIRYHALRAAGYPIGSGIVESGHKVVIGARLKGAGRHWATDRLNPLLVLRTMICNDRWGQMWPRLWSTQHATTAASRQAARQQRRRARQPTVLPAPVVPPRPVVTAGAEPVVVPGPTTASTVSAPARPSGPRRPSANHPWRRPVVPPALRRTG